MPTGIKVRDAMVSKVMIIRSGQNVMEAAAAMKKADVGLLVVIDGKKPMGVITREDIIAKVVALDIKPSTKAVLDVMTRSVIAAEPDEDLSDVARRMVQHGFERLPVISNGKLVGIISDRDIAKVAPAAIEILRERLTMQEEPTVAVEKNEGECEICSNYTEELINVNDKWICEACKEEAESD